ncbi:hypothetical protein SD81_027070 [Tolypothrix campylonemoides VB511288]|nr:hypothetical protein SD81_027070 [Tolypothrix campylonemoides VB511288]
MEIPDKIKPINNSTDATIQDIRDERVWKQGQSMTIHYYGNTPGRHSTSPNSWLAWDCKNQNNVLFQAGGQSLKWVTIPGIPQATQTKSIEFIILPVASVQVLPQNQESLATNQDSSINKIYAVNSVAKLTENVLIRLIEALSKNPEFNLDFGLVCKRIGLEWKWKAELKL